MKNTPNIAFFDIENAPTSAYVWELYEANVIKVIKHSYLLSFAVQWGDGRVITHALPDYPNYWRDKENDKALVKDLWEMMNKADLIVAHNGDAFDIKKANARFILYGLDPPSPYKTVDTLKLARQIGYFGSNKLDSLAQYLSIGRKLPHTGKDLWFGCMTGNERDWRLMRKYNAHDVVLLKEVYDKLRPYAKTHPDLRVYDKSEGCPTCRSHNVQRRGFRYAGSRIYRQYHCLKCGKWYGGETVK